MLKVKRGHPPSDKCIRSLDFLRNRLRPHFPEGNIWIPDHPEDFYGHRPSTKSLNIILLGSALRSLLESEYWPGESCRLWCVSDSMRDVLAELTLLKKEQIGLVSRYEIVRPMDPARHLDLDRELTFVVSGRLTPSKNIRGTVLFVHALQHLLKRPIRMVLIGHYEDDFGFGRGRYQVSSYRTLVHELIEELDWYTKPEHAEPLPPETWTERFGSDAVLLSFSQFFSEDFNVSLAQAEEAGWPAILSSWGGHRDARGDHLRFFPSEWIPSEVFPLSIQKGQAQSLAQLFLSQDGGATSISPKLNEQAAKLFFREDLTLIRRGLIERWGGELLSLLRGQADYFADTTKGAEFFQLYAQAMSGTHGMNAHVLFYPHPTSKEAWDQQAAFDIAQDQVRKNEQLFLIPSCELSEHAREIQRANRFSNLCLGPSKSKIDDLIKSLS